MFATRRAVITLFLAILEMARLHAVVLRQEETFGEIHLKKGRKFDALFVPGALAEAMAALEEGGKDETEPQPESLEPEA